VDLGKQQAGRTDLARLLGVTPVIDGDVYGEVSGAFEHFLGPSEVGGDDVDPEKRGRESGVAPALTDVGHREPRRWRTETDVRVTVRGRVVAEDLDEDFHGEARYKGACVLPLAKLHDASLCLGKLSI